jgi:hypothetical protein
VTRPAHVSTPNCSAASTTWRATIDMIDACVLWPWRVGAGEAIDRRGSSWIVPTVAWMADRATDWSTSAGRIREKFSVCPSSFAAARAAGNAETTITDAWSPRGCCRSVRTTRNHRVSASERSVTSRAGTPLVLICKSASSPSRTTTTGWPVSIATCRHVAARFALGIAIRT